VFFLLLTKPGSDRLFESVFRFSLTCEQKKQNLKNKNRGIKLCNARKKVAMRANHAYEWMVQNNYVYNCYV
jgi:hypothetical protein